MGYFPYTITELIFTRENEKSQRSLCVSIGKKICEPYTTQS